MNGSHFDVTVLASGRGTNFEALLDAIDDGAVRARVTHLVTDRKKAPALALAREHEIPSHVVRPRDHEDRSAWDLALAETVAACTPDLVVLAGFMRIIGPAMLERFGDRMINVHPSLLPAFPGLDGPGQAIRARVRVSGCTVHRVDDGVDTGAILAQAVVPVLADDDAETLHARIQRLEHRLLPRVVDLLAEGALEGAPTDASAMLFSPDVEVER